MTDCRGDVDPTDSSLMQLRNLVIVGIWLGTTSLQGQGGIQANHSESMHLASTLFLHSEGGLEALLDIKENGDICHKERRCKTPA